MGLFDSPEDKNLGEVFPPGTPFRLAQAWIQGVTESPMGGMRTLAKIVVSPVEDPENEREFGVWGSLAEQIRQIETGELPLIVTLDNSLGMWCFAPHGQRGTTVAEDPIEGEAIEVPLTAVPEAHLDLHGGESDNPTPVPPAAAPAGSGIDLASADKPIPLPPAAVPRERPIDEAQAFTPNGDPNKGSNGDQPINQ